MAHIGARSALYTARDCGADCTPCFYRYFNAPHGPHRNL